MTDRVRTSGVRGRYAKLRCPCSELPLAAGWPQCEYTNAQEHSAPPSSAMRDGRQLWLRSCFSRSQPLRYGVETLVGSTEEDRKKILGRAVSVRAGAPVSG